MIVVGLVNNMPDAALQATERQFRELIAAAAGAHSIRIVCFSFPETVRSSTARAYIDNHYAKIDELWEGRFDGLIVTGTEPRTPVLTDEAYWPALTRLVDQAEASTTSTIWSCLAAHGAVQHLDRVQRQKLPEKLSGLFECARATDHPLVEGMPTTWFLPHSRLNTLPEAALTAAGYRMLSTSRTAGTDMFYREGESLFMFVQGHPEYDPGAIYREYQRDVGRFLTGTSERYPSIPRDYFSNRTQAAFDDYQQRAAHHPDPGMLADFPALDIVSGLAHSWKDPAVRLYTNWLNYLSARRA
jgi:homoserine O-succinyltransferase/O-acetyltransferase